MSVWTLLLWLVVLAALGGLAYVLRKGGFLPLSSWEWVAFGFPDIQEKASRQVAASKAAYESTKEVVEALCQSRLDLFRQVKRSIYELVDEWEKLDHDPRVAKEWKEDIHYIYESCYKEMIDGAASVKGTSGGEPWRSGPRSGGI